jgi:hypothetical protein
MRFEILGLGDRQRWTAFIERLEPSQRDVHFLPEYGEIYQRTYGFVPMLAVGEDQSGLVVQPLVKRPLNGLPFLQGVAEPFFDVTNPYGYGGPLVQAGSREAAIALLVEFDRRFRAAMLEQRVPAEFTSLHPLLQNHELLAAAGTVAPADQKDVIFVDLSPSEEELWKETRKGHKSSIKKAVKSGIRIEEIAGPVDFETFNRLYYATMERNRAAERWVFPRDYFRTCLELLGPERVAFFFAWHDRAPAAACIVMHAFETAYYHFSGSDSDYYAMCPNNLMVHEVALWAKRRGYRRFHLGGGVSSSPDDPLFVFKSGFAHRSARLYTYGRVHDSETYARLCRLKQEHELATEGRVSASEFFPLYRR